MVEQTGTSINQQKRIDYANDRVDYEWRRTTTHLSSLTMSGASDERHFKIKTPSVQS